MIALGKDTFSTGKISYDLVEELCQVLKDFSVIMKSYRVSAYTAYATSAMREAKNNPIILEQIRVRTGLEIKLISNSEQRFLSYKAIASKESEFNTIIQKGTAIVDVGFGSMQISLFDTVTDEDVIQELKEIDVSNLTPVDALNTLYRLQNRLKNRWGT